MREIMETSSSRRSQSATACWFQLPFGLAKLQALFLQFAPGRCELTPDQGWNCCDSDNVVSGPAKAAGLTLEGLGIAPIRWKRSRRNISGASAQPERVITRRV